MNVYKLFGEHREFESLVSAKISLPDSIVIENLKFAYKVELAELANEVGFFKHWKHNHKQDDLKILEEWTDGLHILVTLGNMCGYAQFTKMMTQNVKVVPNEQYIPVIFPALMDKVIESSAGYMNILNGHIMLGFHLGYSEDELMAAYQEKLEENIDRQKRGY